MALKLIPWVLRDSAATKFCVSIIPSSKMVKIMKTTTAVFVIIMLSASSSIFADKPNGSVYIDGGNNKSAVILAHGRGKYPTWLVVDPLRKGINEKLGFHTLSLQMTTGYDNWREYADGFPEAYDSIKSAINFVKNEKGVNKIFLMGHSMGSRIVSSFISENPDQSVSGLIVVGCRNNGGYPLSCEENLQDVDIPVLDIWGGNNEKDSNAASDRSGLVSEAYKQVEVSGANHKFEGYESELVSSTVDWLKAQQ